MFKNRSNNNTTATIATKTSKAITVPIIFYAEYIVISSVTREISGGQ